MASGFKMDTSRFKSAKHMEDKLDRAIQGTCRFWDGKIEASMKLNAPWTDRTSNARNGLRAVHVAAAKFKHWILLSHSVEYGIYLEKSNNAKYAIIMPTIRAYAPRVMGTLTKILNRLDQAAGGGR